jgi:hypothetical protein
VGDPGHKKAQVEKLDRWEQLFAIPVSQCLALPRRYLFIGRILGVHEWPHWGVRRGSPAHFRVETCWIAKTVVVGPFVA